MDVRPDSAYIRRRISHPPATFLARDIPMSVYALTQADADALAQQIPVDGVRLLGLDYNWGPPVGGRFDTDYLNVFAGVAGELPGTLYLQGQGVGGAWDLELPFERVGTVQGEGNAVVTVYALSVGQQSQFPQQFVLRFDVVDGPSLYDNNGWRNYALVPYGGRGATAVSTPQAIFTLNGITPYNLLSPT
jgi:hypothetical protein